MRCFGGLNVLLVLEEKSAGKKTRGRLRRTWTDDVIQWTQKKMYGEVKRLAEVRNMTQQPSDTEDDT